MNQIDLNLLQGVYSLTRETDDTITTNCVKCYKGNKQGGVIQLGQSGRPIVDRVIREGLSEGVTFQLIPEAGGGGEVGRSSPIHSPKFKSTVFYNLFPAFHPNI